MSNVSEIRDAIDSLDIDRARALLREALKEPTAEIYFLAARVAIDDEQKKNFLKKAVDLDPFYSEAHSELRKSQGQTPSQPSAASSMSSSPNTNSLPPTPQAGASTFAFPPSQSQTSAVYAPRSTLPADYRLGDTGRRFVGYIIDAIIAGIAGGIVGAVLGAAFSPRVSSYYYYSDYYAALGQFQILAAFAGALISYAYLILFTVSWQGQTPGKRIMGLRIVKIDGSRFTYGDAFMRYVIGYSVSAIFIGLGFLWILFDSQHQGWHDKMAKTLVITEPK